ncbi:MAG: polyprenyl diphosphate synthase [Candidatus Saccharibacteria bacterium]
MSQQLSEQPAIPRHLGIIPDGNRRWAKLAGKPSLLGHKQGLEVANKIAIAAFDEGVEYFTMYAFSTENWRRTKEEVGYLMDLFVNLVVNEFDELEARGVRFQLLGSRKDLSKRVLKAMEDAEKRTENYTNGTLSLALNYGGELELVEAVQQIVASGIEASDITKELIEANLYGENIPPVDMVIRTSSEHRTSGFMLWRSAYAEYFFVNKLWPDYTVADLKAALSEYGRRNRRFGS